MKDFGQNGVKSRQYGIKFAHIVPQSDPTTILGPIE